MISVILLSIKIGLLATIYNLPLSLIISWLLTRKEFRGKSLLDGFINLPMVMPPVTIGYLLLIIFSRNGLLSRVTGIQLAFTTGAAIVTAMVVSFPLMTRSIKVSLTMMDERVEFAAQTLGANRLEQFLRITLPIIKPGIINGLFLGFARSLGEFGATMTFAGNIEGITRTIPLAVYANLQIPGREIEAALLVLVSISISFLAVFFSSRWEKRERQKYGY